MPTDDRPAGDDPVVEAIALLDNRQSAKRRSGAKRLRKLADDRGGPPLLAALRRELQDRRTWETQYHLIMALGECGHREALPFLEELIDTQFEATMIYVSLGDALVRLSTPLDERLSVVRQLLERGNPDLADGAIRAVAMLRLVPSREAIDALITYVEEVTLREPPIANRRFWVAAAAPGWLDESPRVKPFLETCLDSGNAGLEKAAAKALKGKYSAWKPL